MRISDWSSDVCSSDLVDRVFHDFAQNAFFVACQQRVPVSAPYKLDDVPAAAPEIAFELLDDFPVAAHRTIKALQIAVDDKNEIVELFTRCQADGAQRSEEHKSELQSLMRISYAVFCL